MIKIKYFKIVLILSIIIVAILFLGYNNKKNNLLPLTTTAKIVFVSDRDGNNEIYTMSANGNNINRLTNYPGNDNDPNWSPDGKKIVFASSRGDITGRRDIFIMSSDGTNLIRVTKTKDDNFMPTFSPDGKKIAFVSFKTGNPEIFSINIDGTNKTQLTFNSGRKGNYPQVVAENGYNFDPERAMDVQPNWRPGLKILFCTNRDKGHFTLYSMNSDGSNQKNISPTNVNSCDPSWSPDEKKIIFGSDRKGGITNIYSMNIDSSNVIQLTHFKTYTGDGNWSSDGKYITFEHSQEVSEKSGLAEVWTMNSDGSNQQSTHQKCSSRDCAPRWQPISNSY